MFCRVPFRENLFFSFEFAVIGATCPHTPAAAQSVWSSRTINAVDANPSATSSVESWSANLSAVPVLGDSMEEIDSVDIMPARESSVVAVEPELQFPRETETTVVAGRGKTVRVTLVEPQIGKRRLKSWCWQFVSRLSPSINKNVLCLVKQRNGKTCDHLMKWTPSDGSNKGTGTSGLIKHLEVPHPAMIKKIKDEIGTSEERKAPIRAAIGECFEKEKKGLLYSKQ